jgi:hypothetical protein
MRWWVGRERIEKEWLVGGTRLTKKLHGLACSLKMNIHRL